MKHQKTIEQEVNNFITRHNLISDAKKILIGLSGGADSVFALHFFNKFSEKFEIKISAVHINHSLRKNESLRDELFCKKLCADLKIEFKAITVDVKKFASKNKKSIEEAARILRYKEMLRLLKVTGSDLIVTAHNNDDNTETVLLNIVNGSGLDGVSGIPIKRDNIIRPFLCISKTEIKNYLFNLKLKFVEDSSNQNLEYRRNFLRNEVIPLLKKNINPSLDKVILNSSEVFRNQSRVLNYFVNELAQRIIKKDSGILSISIKEIRKYPDEIFGELFKVILKQNFKINFSFNKFQKLRNLIDVQVGTNVNLGKQLVAYRERGKILITKFQKEEFEEHIIEFDKKVNIGEFSLKIEYINSLPKKYTLNNKIEYISADKISGDLKIRKWKIGDKIQLLGMKGTKKISDVLTDLKIPSFNRKNQFVLIHENDIICIVGIRISEKFKVTTNTKKIVKICLN